MIKNKSFNRILAESLFNLAKSKKATIEAGNGNETEIFELMDVTSVANNDHNESQ